MSVVFYHSVIHGLGFLFVKSKETFSSFSLLPGYSIKLLTPLREEKLITQSHSVNFLNELNADAKSKMFYHCSNNIVISVLPI